MSYEVAQCFQRYHAEKLNKRVDEYETLLRKIYKEMVSVTTGYLPNGLYIRVFGYHEVIPSDDMIGQYISKCRRKIKEYEEDWTNVDMCNLMEGDIDYHFPIHYLKDLRMMSLGFRIFTRCISSSKVMYLVHRGEEFFELYDHNCDGSFLPFKGPFEVFLWSDRFNRECWCHLLGGMDGFDIMIEIYKIDQPKICTCKLCNQACLRYRNQAFLS